MEHWLLSIPPLAVYVAVALVVGLESLGIPLPGEIVLVSAAVLAAADGSSLSPHGVAAAAVLGAVGGDSIGYLIGRRYGPRLFAWLGRRFPRHFDDDVIAYAEHVFHRWGMLAVFLGRFVALLRIFAGPLSGSLHLRYGRFLVANVAGAIAWGAGTTYLVYFLGRAAETYLKDFSYAGLGLAVAIGIACATLLRRRMSAQVQAFRRERAGRS